MHMCVAERKRKVQHFVRMSRHHWKQSESKWGFQGFFFFPPFTTSSFANRPHDNCIPLCYRLSSIFSAHVIHIKGWEPFLWLLLASSLRSVLMEERSPSGLFTGEIKMCGYDKKISQKLYKVRQHRMVMFHLCLCLSTFNDVLRCSLGRKTHISMQMRRQTQTNVLVLWITTYQTRTRRPDY